MNSKYIYISFIIIGILIMLYGLLQGESKIPFYELGLGLNPPPRK